MRNTVKGTPRRILNRPQITDPNAHRAHTQAKAHPSPVRGLHHTHWHDMENEQSSNPMFNGPLSAESEEVALPHKSKSRHIVVGHMSTGLALTTIQVDTTLGDEDWDLIEDDLLPFEILVGLVSLGGIALFALGIHMMAAPNYLVQFTQEFSGVFYLLDSFLTLLFTLPILVGALQVALAIVFGLGAACEKYSKMSIQDFVMYFIPSKITQFSQQHVRFHCTVRGAYVWVMVLFLLLQLVISGIALGVNDFVSSTVNQGQGGDASEGLMRTVLDYSSAVFNTCCDDRGWSKQGRIAKCPLNSVSITTCNMTEPKFNSLQSKLCACYVADEQEFARYEQFVNQSGLCNTATKLVVQLGKNQLIPGTVYPFRTLVPAANVSIPVVGDPNTQYGCGLGALRGFQWALVEWCTAELRPYFVGILAISGLQLLIMAIGLSIVCRVKRERVLGEDGNYGYVDKKQGVRGLESIMLVRPIFKFSKPPAASSKSAIVTAATDVPDVPTPVAVKRVAPPRPQRPNQPPVAPVAPAAPTTSNIDDIL
ncbi:hypothetical protein BASA81_005491 [Batrachochytrium salamandrivorans]|nr:hypothetical protein BASA81_005491 [Batrachochytrium salamandrivorans]